MTQAQTQQVFYRAEANTSSLCHQAKAYTLPKTTRAYDGVKLERPLRPEEPYDENYGRLNHLINW